MPTGRELLHAWELLAAHVRFDESEGDLTLDGLRLLGQIDDSAIAREHYRFWAQWLVMIAAGSWIVVFGRELSVRVAGDGPVSRRA